MPCPHAHRAVVSFMATAETERIASLAAAFRSLDPAGRGVVPYDSVVALLNNGEWDLSRTGERARAAGAGARGGGR